MYQGSVRYDYEKRSEKYPPSLRGEGSLSFLSKKNQWEGEMPRAVSTTSLRGEGSISFLFHENQWVGEVKM